MSGMSKSNKPIIVVIQVLLLLVMAFYFLKFGKEHQANFITIDAKQFRSDTDKAFRDLNQKKITQHIVHLNKDRLFPEITESFIGRGPILAFKNYSSDNDK